jgi:hypothetical protein
MNLRFIERDGKRILQFKSSRFTDWQDVPFVVDQTAPTEPTDQDIEELESGTYRMGLMTVNFSKGQMGTETDYTKCWKGSPDCHCRES